ncbi:MAG: hypothetical protein HGB35_08440 [Geobacteraceae bacterium]|nr:hypothetical protein [Geobacteraceae bacterium]
MTVLGNRNREMEVYVMATTILILTVVLLAIAVTPWIGSISDFKVYKVDSMAGDEGED